MKNNDIVLWGMLFFLSSFNNFAEQNAVTNTDATIDYIVDEGMIRIASDNFEKFLRAIVAAGLQSPNKELVSKAVFNCYEQVMHESKLINVQDLQEAMPELFEIINSYCQEHGFDLKAPRPQQHNGFVGPGACNLTEVFNVLRAILAKLHACCDAVSSDVSLTLSVLETEFNGTFSVLNGIEQELQGTFTVIADIIDTLTVCCDANTFNFNGTFSALAAGFDGTFTMLNTVATQEVVNAILDVETTVTTCCATLQTDFQETWTILETFNQTTTMVLSFLPHFQQTWSILEAGFQGTYSALDACCDTINREFQETWSILEAGFDGTFSVIDNFQLDESGTFSALATIENILITDFNATWSTLNAGFNGTFSALNELKNTDCLGTLTVFAVGFQGTFSALDACCNTITSEFQETWSIVDRGFESTFSLLADIKANIGSSTLLADFTGVYTALNAGFNGTFSAIVAIENNTIVIDEFNGTFSVLEPLFQCLSISVTVGENITTPGYYCLANDINGSFTITANNVVLDLNTHTVSNGGIFVLTGTHRTVKDGRLDNSNAGIVLTANSNTNLDNLVITNALTSPAITFTGNHFDNAVNNVAIENCAIGLSSTNDTHLMINNLTIQGVTNVGMTFTNSNSLTITKASVLNAGSLGIDLTNATKANLYDITLYNVRQAGLMTYGTTAHCIFEDLEITNANMLFGVNLNAATNCSLKNCLISLIGTTTVSNAFTGIFLGPTVGQGGSNNSIDSCVIENINTTSTFNGIVNRSSNTIINNCVVQRCVSGSNALGFSDEGSNCAYFDCIVSQITSVGGDNNGSVSGFSFVGDNTQIFKSMATSLVTTSSTGNECNGFYGDVIGLSYYDCVAQEIASIAPGGVQNGFQIVASSDNVIMKGCVALVSGGTGFLLSDGFILTYQCQSIGHSVAGFSLTTLNTLLSECIAVRNDTGILLAFNDVGIYHCLATQNTTNYDPLAYNIQLQGASNVLPGVNVTIP